MIIHAWCILYSMYDSSHYLASCPSKIFKGSYFYILLLNNVNGVNIGMFTNVLWRLTSYELFVCLSREMLKGVPSENFQRKILKYTRRNL